jgi:hypothetical protein
MLKEDIKRQHKQQQVSVAFGKLHSGVNSVEVATQPLSFLFVAELMAASQQLRQHTRRTDSLREVAKVNRRKATSAAGKSGDPAQPSSGRLDRPHTLVNAISESTSAPAARRSSMLVPRVGGKFASKAVVAAANARARKDGVVDKSPLEAARLPPIATLSPNTSGAFHSFCSLHIILYQTTLPRRRR